ncbi:hypothetical protein CA13_57380 [Planctomycetes bacterium CA13]|uniref:Uncharacterized protein n=1 Tax=Novipirellula herctigrandis TaxID=2527986 RepID=A0A5C5ZAA6_9BACT|nr:hypothetical protein CA13_57380 [Planctomycetes bacterium CA13]
MLLNALSRKASVTIFEFGVVQKPKSIRGEGIACANGIFLCVYLGCIHGMIGDHSRLRLKRGKHSQQPSSITVSGQASSHVTFSQLNLPIVLRSKDNETCRSNVSSRGT